MKIASIVFAWFLILSFCLIHSNAFVSIDIDPDDLDKVGEFIQTIINGERGVPPKKLILKKAFFGSIHLLGVMMALVGANVLSTILITDVPVPVVPVPDVSVPQLIEPNQIQANKTELCYIDYGCINGVCWRRCNTDVKEDKLWCHTGPNPQLRKMQPCSVHSDCSICWECLESCHT